MKGYSQGFLPPGDLGGENPAHLYTYMLTSLPYPVEALPNRDFLSCKLPYINTMPMVPIVPSLDFLFHLCVSSLKNIQDTVCTIWWMYKLWHGS